MILGCGHQKGIVARVPCYRAWDQWFRSSEQRKSPFDSPVRCYHPREGGGGTQVCCPPGWGASSLSKTNCADCCYFPNEVMIEFASSFIHQNVSIVLLALHASISSLEPVRRHLLSAFRLSCLASLISSLKWDKWPTANHFRTQWCIPVKSLSQGHVIASISYLISKQTRLNTIKSVLVLS